MDTLIFEKIVNMHSLCKGNMLYNGNALAGETGEVCNNIKKIHMAIIKPKWVSQKKNALPKKEVFKEKLNDELGDALFYLTRIALDNGTSLNEIMAKQCEKLNEQSIKYRHTFLK